MMKGFLPIFYILFLAHAVKAQETNVSLELGKSIRPNQYLGMLKYRKYFDILYTEGGAGAYGPERGVGLAHIQLGLFYKNISIGTGPACISRPTDRLGTNFQFLSSLAIRFGNSNQFYIKYSHISNGASFTGLSRPNGGEDFISLGYSIKI